MVAYSDAEFGNSKDGKSITGFLFIIIRSPISSSSKKQSIIAQSTSEAETVALSECCREWLWIKKVFRAMHVHVDCVTIYVDKNTAISIVKQKGLRNRTKPINVKFLLAQQLYKHHIIEVHYCSTKQMLVDF